MKYGLLLLVLFAACSTPDQKAQESLSAQYRGVAEKSLDSIHLLLRRAAAKEVPIETVEPKIELLKEQVKKYALALNNKDSVAFREYERKKEEETMEFIAKQPTGR